MSVPNSLKPAPLLKKPLLAQAQLRSAYDAFVKRHGALNKAKRYIREVKVIDEETGLLAPPGSPNELATQLERVLSDADLRRLLRTQEAGRLAQLVHKDRSLTLPCQARQAAQPWLSRSRSQHL